MPEADPAAVEPAPVENGTVTEAAMLTVPTRLVAWLNASPPISFRAPSVLKVTLVMPPQFSYSWSGMRVVGNTHTYTKLGLV